MKNVERALFENKYLGFSVIYDLCENVLYKEIGDIYIEVSGIDNHKEIVEALITVGLVGDSKMVLAKTVVKRHRNLRPKLKSLCTEIADIIDLMDLEDRNKRIIEIVKRDVQQA